MDDMMDMMGGMGVMMLVGLLVVAIVVGVAVYLAIRAAHGSDSRDAHGSDSREPDARELLERRLASGEITPEEFHERQSALRDAQPARQRR